MYVKRKIFVARDELTFEGNYLVVFFKVTFLMNRCHNKLHLFKKKSQTTLHSGIMDAFNDKSYNVHSQMNIHAASVHRY